MFKYKKNTTVINQIVSAEPQIIGCGSNVKATTGSESLERAVKRTLFRTETNIEGNGSTKSH